MKDYKTIQSEGKRIHHLNHVVILMQTEKDVKINEIFNKIKDSRFMEIENKYINSITHVIKLIRSWENEKISISYENTARPVLGITFSLEDIESIIENRDKEITINLKDNFTINLYL